MNKTLNSQRWCLLWLVLFLSSGLEGDGQEAWHLLLRTAPRRRPSRLGQYWQKTLIDVFNTHTVTFPRKNGLSSNRHDNLFLPGYSSSPGWLLVTRTRGAWWCCYRGHCRSGPRHRSPRSRVCAQEWHREDIHSHIHSHTPMHTPQKQKRNHKKKKKKRSTHQTWCLRLLVFFLSSGLVGDGQKAWHLLLWTAPRRRPSRLGQYWQKASVDVFSKYTNIASQQCPSKQPAQ